MHKGYTNNTERILITQNRDMLANNIQGGKHDTKNEKRENIQGLGTQTRNTM